MTTEKKKSRLTPLQWAEIEAKWKSGEYTLSMLEEEYGVRPETFSRYFKKKGIAKGSDSVGEMVRESLKSDAELRAKARAEKIENRRSTFDSWAVTLGKLTMSEIAQAKTTKKPLETIEDNIKALQRASTVIQKCFDVSSRALGMDKDDADPDEIPNLVFGELTPQQVEQLQRLDENSFEEVEEDDSYEEELVKELSGEYESDEEDEVE